MSDSKPSVSVLMPVYNAVSFVREAAESILAQTYGDFEFIIIDDGSTDGSGCVIGELQSSDRRIRVLRNETNQGLTYCLNEAVKMSVGSLLARMDADDVALPQRLERQVSFMLAHPGCVALGTQVEFIDEDGELLRRSEHPLEHAEIETRLWRGDGLVLVHPSAMMRRQAVIGVGCYRKEAGRAEDLDLYLRLSEYGLLANLSDYLMQMRCHPSSVTSVGSKDHADRMLMRVLREAALRRGRNPEEIQLGNFPQARSIGHWHTEWAWRVYKRRGSCHVARKHAWRGLVRQPFQYEAWRAFVYAFGGRAMGSLIRSVVRGGR